MPTALALLVILGLSSCAWWKKVERTTASDPFDRVEARFQADIETVRKTLLEMSRIPHYSQDILARFPDPGVFMVADADDDQIFPHDQLIRANLDRSPWLKTYLNLAKDARTRDLDLYAVTDLFWPSEYVYAGGPAKFYTDFLLHLEPVSETTTRVEVFEYLPRIWVGESFQLGAHGPCMCRDQRWVRQTKQDRVALLAAIGGVLDARGETAP